MPDLDDLNFVDTEVDLGEVRPLQKPYCEFLTGEAGTGKTYELKRRIEEDPHYGILAATTGIAAVNLNSTTINSVLGYYDTASLETAFIKNWLHGKLRRLVVEEGYRNLCIDEVSMMPARQLDTIYNALISVNANLPKEFSPLGLVLTGDFCQLPPIVPKERRVRGQKSNPEWVFKAECWPEFAANTNRLTKIWRQTDPKFLETLSYLRHGQAMKATEAIQNVTKFQAIIDARFDGTTILGNTAEADNANSLYLQRLKGRPIVVPSTRWGVQRGEWRQIPDQLQLKIGALVMVLVNNPPSYSYVNGDLGHIVEFEEDSFQVELIRTGQVERIGLYHQTAITREEQEVDEMDIGVSHVYCACPRGGDELRDRVTVAPFGEKSWNCKQESWNVGGVLYYPLRLAHAIHVHKTQGLTLDRVQIDFRNFMFKTPGSLYVAISRCRTPQGLRLVGVPKIFHDRCVIDKEIEPWL